MAVEIANERRHHCLAAEFYRVFAKEVIPKLKFLLRHLPAHGGGSLLQRAIQRGFVHSMLLSEEI